MVEAFFVRPAWMPSWRGKSSRKLITASDVKRNSAEWLNRVLTIACFDRPGVPRL